MNCRSTRQRALLVLLGSTSTHSKRTDDDAVPQDRDTTGREHKARVDRIDPETADAWLCNLPKVPAATLPRQGRVRLARRDRVRGELRPVHPDECDRVTALVDRAR